MKKEVIISNIENYFKENQMNYEVIDVFRYRYSMNNYTLVARHKNYPEIKREYGGDEYVAWNCWNESTQCLNWGQYDLTLEDAIRITLDYAEVN